MPEVRHAIPMPLGHGAFAFDERRRLGLALRETGYDRAYVLPNSFKSALIPYFSGIKQRIGWRGEMRYFLLNDMRILDKEAFPMMVQRYVALAYDKERIQSAADLPQPLLWPQLQVRDEEIAEITASFNLTDNRPIIGFCRSRVWPSETLATLSLRRTGAETD